MHRISRYQLKKDNTGGKVQFFLSGFSRQKIISDTEIIAAIDKIPDAHLQGLKGLYYDPTRSQLYFKDFQQWPKLINAKGSFDLNDGFVTLYSFDDKKMFYHVLYHEVGHYVFYAILAAQLKKRWVTQLYPRSTYISPYAKTSAMEDFAESYASFILEPSKLKRISSKYNFLHSQVFKGIEF